MYRDVKLAPAADKAKPAAIAITLFANTKTLPHAYAALDKAHAGILSAALERPDFSAGPNSILTLFSHAEKGVRIYILGLGEETKFDSQRLREAGAQVLTACLAARITSLSILTAAALGDRSSGAEAGRALGEGLGMANFQYEDQKGAAAARPDKSKAKPIDLTVRFEASLRAGAEAGLTIARATNITRHLIATPPNIANPAYIVSQARKLAAGAGLGFSVIDYKQAKKLGMGGLCAVGQAGSTPPAMICLQHKPAKARNKAPILLVGKAVTFDTGGYSLKINNGMLGMKYDKSGGMAVLGAMLAIARLKLPVNVVALIPTVENMIDQGSYRPDDIITMHNGVTVEVTNTDAEGRLILADALSYGCEKYKPAAVIDLATLTGGVVVALGSVCAGIFCTDSNLRSAMMDAAEQSGERIWHLPLWQEYRDMMKATHADILNSAPVREAHPIQGAAFLSYFLTDGATQMPTIPWAHVDIAGVAEAKGGSPHYRKGPTG